MDPLEVWFLMESGGYKPLIEQALVQEDESKQSYKEIKGISYRSLCHMLLATTLSILHR